MQEVELASIVTMDPPTGTSGQRDSREGYMYGVFYYDNRSTIFWPASSIFTFTFGGVYLAKHKSLIFMCVHSTTIPCLPSQCPHTVPWWSQHH